MNLESIDVGGTTLQLPARVFETGEKKGTIIDSGTTLTYLPELVFQKVMFAVRQRSHALSSLVMEDDMYTYILYFSTDCRYLRSIKI